MRRLLAGLALSLVVLAALAAGLVWTGAAPWPPGSAAPVPARPEPAAAVADADRRLRAEIASLAPQRPGHPDLYVLAVAGDGSERVFLNEARHLRDVAERRMDARGRVLVLANHPAEPPWRAPVPATLATIRTALAGIGAAMDPDEDILLLYVTTHGSDEHWLLLRRDGVDDAELDAPTLRDALDEAGIRHRVLALSACYAGGLAPALQTPDTLVLAAARADRTSFGCGNDSVATFFGRAWLVDGLNATVDFAAAFRRARVAIRDREAAQDYLPSRPQIREGERIGARLAAWRAAFEPGVAVPYPHAEPTDAELAAARDDDIAWDGPGVIPPLLPFHVLEARGAVSVPAVPGDDRPSTP